MEPMDRHAWKHAIIDRTINFCWCWFKWGIFATVVGAALLVPYFYHRLDEEIRARLEQRLAVAYPALHVRLRSAMLVKGEGITIRGLTIVDPAGRAPARRFCRSMNALWRAIPICENC